jgi:hypothetical protein
MASGFAYYFPGPHVREDQAGWTKDAITGGSIEFIIDNDGNNPDIVFSDVSRTRSSRADGAQVVALPGETPNSFLVIVIYPQHSTIEHYLFMLDARGRGTVAWGTARAVAQIQKSSLYAATCSR